ncbi:MAG: PadR family transcriptional regulator [Spirochaetota bacterium]
MALKHVILGWLHHEPMTGYDLNAIIARSTRHFWTSSQSQIYRSLAKLEEAGLVTQEVVHQEDRPSRKVYHITAQGSQELKRWLATPHEPDPPRVTWLIQVFFAGSISDTEILRVLAAKRRELEERISTIRAVRSRSAAQFTGNDSRRDMFFWLLSVEYGEAQLEARLGWIRDAIHVIETKAYEKRDLDHYRTTYTGDGEASDEEEQQ